MNARDFYQRGINGSYKFDLEEMAKSSLPFSYLLDSTESGDLDLDRYSVDFISESQVMVYENIKRHNHDKGYRDKKIVPINEVTQKEIIKGADSKRLARSKKLTCKYVGCTDARGWIKFRTNSQYTPSLKYTQYIKLAEASDMKYFKEFKKKDIVRLFLFGDLQVYCSCKDFKYRHSYQSYQMGYGIFKENRYPKIANPRLEGTVCKHLLCVLSVLNMNWSSIQKDLIRTKFFKRKYEDEEYMKELDKKKAMKASSRKSK